MDTWISISEILCLEHFRSCRMIGNLAQPWKPMLLLLMYLLGIYNV